MLKRIRIVAGILCALAASASLHPQQAQAATTTITIDDTDPRWDYSPGDATHGGWTAYGSGTPDQTEHWTNSDQATIALTFEGSGLELYGKKAPNHTKFTVSIDGGITETYDEYAQNTMKNQLVYTSDHLEYGTHTAKITAIKDRNEHCTEPDQDIAAIQFEYARVRGVPIDLDENVTTLVDDASHGGPKDLYTFSYSGAWVAESGHDDMFHQGTDHYCFGEGSSWSMNFKGSSIEIYGRKKADHGIYGVQIDGQARPDIDATQPSSSTVDLLASYNDLDPKSSHTITVSLKSGSSIQIDYVSITHKPILADDITVTPAKLDIESGRSARLTYALVPSIAIDLGVVWTSADQTIAKVDPQGQVTAGAVNKTCTTTITATCNETGIVKKIPVTVHPVVKNFNAYAADKNVLETASAYDAALGNFTNSWSDTAWRGDVRNARLGITTRDHEVKNVTITASDLVSENGHRIASNNIDIAWLKDVKAGDYGSSFRPTYPDIIYKGGPLNIPAKTLQSAWINVNVPVDAAAGTYTATFTVTADEAEPITLSYRLEVINLVQPNPQDMGYEMQLWQHPFSVAGYYFANSRVDAATNPDIPVDPKLLTTDAFKQVASGPLKDYAQMGGHDVVASIVEDAWNNQSYFTDPSMITWKLNDQGDWSFDYSVYDAWIKLADECGVINLNNKTGAIKCYSMVSWSDGGFKYVDAETGETKTLSCAFGSTEWKHMWHDFLIDFHKHSEKLGSWDITFISMDERNYNQLKTVVDLVSSVENAYGFDIKLSSALNIGADQKMVELSREIDDISMNIMTMGDMNNFRALADERHELGLSTTIYNCTGGYPNSFMSSDPGEGYWTMWFAQSAHTNGYLRWAFDDWINTMFGDATYARFEAGDCWMIYPLELGKDGMFDPHELASHPSGFYSTPRKEMLEEGVRDISKARYLASAYPQLADQVNKLTDSLVRPQNKTDAAIAHSESARMYQGITDLARTVAETPVDVDKSALIDLYHRYLNEHLSPTAYREDSWKRYQRALDAAKTVIDNPNATQKDVENALTELQNAHDALEPCNPAPVPPDGNTGDNTEGTGSKQTSNSNKTLVQTGDPGTLCFVALGIGGLSLACGGYLAQRNRSDKHL